MPNQQPLEEVIIFTRYPEPGKVKTRLVPHLGEKKAALLHRLLTEQIVHNILPLAQMRPVRISLHFTGATLEQMRDWLGMSILLAEQRGEDLGQKMAAALRAACSRGAPRTVLIGTDSPSVDAVLLAQALDELLTHDIVLGPAHDGGYYLIGTNGAVPEEKLDILFEGIAWGSAEVFSRTVEKAGQENLSIAMLEAIHDIDRPEDLEYFHYHTDP
ncbi:MAG: TIGR04282 family arsenosugar biosynthesis glycosyltransferase [Desulfobulbaceae bacterium]|nr:TIGR04282 family arsenosugar biosynthesis glycosyltransferase [Desulfobulbaceae bacterium]